MVYLFKIVLLLIPSVLISQILVYDGINLSLVSSKNLLDSGFTKHSRNTYYKDSYRVQVDRNTTCLSLPFNNDDYLEVTSNLFYSFKYLSSYKIEDCLCNDYKNDLNQVYTVCDCLFIDRIMLLSVSKK